MASWLSTLCLLLTAGTAPVDTQFIQVAPAQTGGIVRSAGQDRAVVLLEGLHLHLLKPARAALAELRPWQQSRSVLVRALTSDADVYAFTYGQTAPVTDIADLPALGADIQRLRQAGYARIVLIGFSAGGVVARQFVEDNPGAGVTKVIQVCSPNVGSGLAKVQTGLRSVQNPFLKSLTKKSRSHALEERRGKRIPAGVEFVCVVGNGLYYGDGVVSSRSQWPDDLQAQGVPAVPLGTEHWVALRGERTAHLIARLVREMQAPWDAARVTAMRQRLFHERKSAP